MYIRATEPALRDRLARTLTHAGVPVATRHDDIAGTVVLTAAPTVDDAVNSNESAWRSPNSRLLIVADAFSRTGVLRAIRIGARVMLHTTNAGPAQLLAAVHAACLGDCRLPHEALSHLILTAPKPPTHPPPATTPLTPRQTTVLTLIAEGLGNAEIADALSCSEHTVKNIIYDMMARLQVRNRTHAVAHALRLDLIQP